MVAHHGTPGKFANAGTFLHKFNMQMQKASRLNRRTKLGIVDGHEIHKLARTNQPKAFHRQYARRLGQCLDNHDTRHDGSSREVPLKKPFIHGHGLDRTYTLVNDELFYAVDQQHGVTVRKHRHDPANVIISEIAPRHTVYRLSGCAAGVAGVAGRACAAAACACCDAALISCWIC